MRRAAIGVAVIITMTMLSACGSDEPEPQITATPTQTSTESETPTADPSEAAEAAAIEAVERYAGVRQSAGAANDWTIETLSEGMRGAELENHTLVPLNVPFEGEYLLTDLVIESLNLTEATVLVCENQSTWVPVGTEPVPQQLTPRLALFTVEPGDDDRWYVTVRAIQDQPCE